MRLIKINIEHQIILIEINKQIIEINAVKDDIKLSIIDIGLTETNTIKLINSITYMINNKIEQLNIRY